METAKALYLEICQLDNDDAEAWFMLGAINSTLGKTDAPIECSRNRHCTCPPEIRF